MSNWNNDNLADKHVAFISPRFAEGTTVGGAETLLKQMALRLAARKVKITFLATCAENHATWENTLPAGSKQIGPIELIRFPTDRKDDPGAFAHIQDEIMRETDLSIEEERKWISNSVNSQAMYDHIRELGDQYDALITGPYLFGITWYAAQIIPERTLLIPCLHDEPYARLKIMKELFEKVQGILYNAEPEAELAQRLYGVSPDKGRLVGMGLDPFDGDGDAFIKKFNIKRPYVLYCGRRELGKGTPLMTHYLSTFRERTGQDLILICTGSGDIEAPPEFRGHLLDLGFVSEEDKHNAMAGAKAFIHPSLNESFGIVLLESFLAKTPALVHAKCNVLQWQCERSNAGFWFRHYPDFEEELRLLLENDKLNQTMGESGRRFVVEDYSWAAVEQRLLDAMTEFLP